MLEAGPVSGHRHFKHPLQIYELFLNKLYIHLKKRKKMEITVTIKADKEELSALNNKKEESTKTNSDFENAFVQALVKAMVFAQQV